MTKANSVTKHVMKATGELQIQKYHMALDIILSLNVRLQWEAKATERLPLLLSKTHGMSTYNAECKNSSTEISSDYLPPLECKT